MVIVPVPEGMSWLSGGCHCGAIRFTFRITNDFYTTCNCSYCTIKGAKHYRVALDEFNLVAKDACIGTYQFGTWQAKHIFCLKCGAATYCHPRSSPSEVNVNLNCLGSAHLDWLQALDIRLYDGRKLAIHS